MHEPPLANKVDPAVPKALAEIAARAMAKDPEQRFRSARSFARELRQWLDDNPAGADGEKTAPAAAPPRRSRALLGIVAAAVVAAAAAALGTWYALAPSSPLTAGNAPTDARARARHAPRRWRRRPGRRPNRRRRPRRPRRSWPRLRPHRQHRPHRPSLRRPPNRSRAERRPARCLARRTGAAERGLGAARRRDGRGTKHHQASAAGAHGRNRCQGAARARTARARSARQRRPRRCGRAPGRAADRHGRDRDQPVGPGRGRRRLVGRGAADHRAHAERGPAPDRHQERRLSAVRRLGQRQRRPDRFAAAQVRIVTRRFARARLRVALASAAWLVAACVQAPPARRSGWST